MFRNFVYIFQNAIKYKNHPNLKIIWFEEMKRDLTSVIKNIANFIGYHLTELKIIQLEKHLHIDNLRNILTEGFGGDPSWEKFFRKGTIGDWRSHLKENHFELWNNWILENIDGSEIQLPKH